MKKNLLFLLCSFIYISSFAQDTTSWNMIGISSGAQVVFFGNDSTDLTSLSLPTTVDVGHAIFVNPSDSLTYTILRNPLADSQRDLYLLNPLNGTITLVHNYAADYISSADIGPGNIVYAIQGNGSANQNTIITLDLNTMIESTLTVSSVLSSKALEFYPGDSSLYIYEGFSDSLFIIDLLTLNEISVTTTGLNDELHGCFYSDDADIFFLSSYGGEMFYTDASYIAGTQYYNSLTSQMDLCYAVTLRAKDDTINLCPNDSAMISLIYDVNSFSWYKNGVQLSATNDSIWVTSGGTYRALMEIGTTANFMWSEPIVVQNATIPNVTISQAQNDSLICPGDLIVLNGASGGSLQWYLNGSLIVGANSSTYAATTSGSYNQMKTNMSGCSDTATSPFIIYDDLNCSTATVSEISNSKINIFPNPVTNNLLIESEFIIYSIEVFNIAGKLVMSTKNINNIKAVLDLSSLSPGSYFLHIENEQGTVKHKLIK